MIILNNDDLAKFIAKKIISLGAWGRDPTYNYSEEDVKGIEMALIRLIKEALDEISQLEKELQGGEEVGV